MENLDNGTPMPELYINKAIDRLKEAKLIPEDYDPQVHRLRRVPRSRPKKVKPEEG